jgi:hypothetical protein
MDAPLVLSGIVPMPVRPLPENHAQGTAPAFPIVEEDGIAHGRSTSMRSQETVVPENG